MLVGHLRVLHARPRSGSRQRQTHRRLLAATMSTQGPRRTVICTDALEWLQQQASLPCVITSLPDISELQEQAALGVKDAVLYRQFLVDTTALIVGKLRPGCVAIFCQTSVLFKGEFIDKAAACTTGALSVGAPQIWHKVMLRADVNTLRPGKLPGWSSLVAYASPADVKDSQLIQSGPDFPDVFQRGDMAWPKAMGVDAAVQACKFVRGRGASEVYDPFCGSGTILAAANYVGMAATGIDLSPKRARHANVMEIVKVDGALKAIRSTDLNFPGKDDS